MKYFRPHFVPLVLSFVLIVSGVFSLLSQPVRPMRPVAPVLAPGSVVREGNSLPVDCSVAACIALTFDDGPSAKNTGRVLDVLASKRARVTFFVVGNHAARHPDIVRRMHQDGHEVGNHSWSHANLAKLTLPQIEEQILSTQNAVVKAGVPAPVWLRPPYGAVSQSVRAHVPLAIALWNIDPEDWHKKDPAAIKDAVLANAGRGRVVLLHDTHAPTAEALPALIDELRAHYNLVTMSELFSVGPGSRGEFYGR